MQIYKRPTHRDSFPNWDYFIVKEGQTISTHLVAGENVFWVFGEDLSQWYKELACPSDFLIERLLQVDTSKPVAKGFYRVVKL